jgi:hypothetical protein
MLAIDQDGFTQVARTTTDQAGLYRFDLPQGFTGTVEPQPPAGSGTFTNPNGDSFYFISNLAGPLVSQNFTFTPTKSDQTVFVDLAGIAVGSEGVVFNLSPSPKSGVPGATRTGEVTLKGVEASTRVRPSLGGYRFQPVELPVGDKVLSFVLDTITVGGRVVTNSGGDPVASAILIATDSTGAIAPQVAIAGADGGFSFVLPRGWQGAAMVRRSGFSLDGTAVPFSADNAAPIARLVGDFANTGDSAADAVAEPESAVGGDPASVIEVELTWTGSADLDLRVVTPEGQVIDPSVSSVYTRDDPGAEGSVASSDRLVLSAGPAGAYAFEIVLGRNPAKATRAQASVRVLKGGSEVSGSPLLDGSFVIDGLAEGTVLRQSVLQID